MDKNEKTIIELERVEEMKKIDEAIEENEQENGNNSNARAEKIISRILIAVAIIVVLAMMGNALIYFGNASVWHQIGVSQERERREAAFLSSIFEQDRSKNTEEGNKKIHAQYPSVTEFTISKDIQVRYLGIIEDKYVFEMYRNSKDTFVVDYTLYDSNFYPVTRATEECMGEKLSHAKDFGGYAIEGRKPTLVCMNKDSFGRTPAYIKDEHTQNSEFIKLTKEPAQYPEQLIPFGEPLVQDTESGKEKGMLKLRYVEKYIHKEKRNNSFAEYLVVYIDVTFPNGYDGRIYNLDESYLCRLVEGDISCTLNIDLTSSQNCPENLVLPEDVVKKYKKFGGPIRETTVRFVRVFNSNGNNFEKGFIVSTGYKNERTRLF